MPSSETTEQALPAPARPTEGTAPAGRAESTLSQIANSLILSVARHWLLLLNVAVALYLALPVLAPTLLYQGWTTPARLLYSAYSFACHQLPDHSYFLFGSQPVYDLPALEANGMEAGLDLLQRRSFIGNQTLGYKIAICQRDVAIYGSVLLAGLAFGVLRRRLRGISWKLYALLLIPIALDGLTQMVGLRTSTWWLRLITGALFGAASVWLAYPYLDEAMQDVIQSEAARRERPDTTGEHDLRSG